MYGYSMFLGWYGPIMRYAGRISSCSLIGNSYIYLRDPGSWSIPLDWILEHLEGCSSDIEVSTFVSTDYLSFEWHTNFS